MRKLHRLAAAGAGTVALVSGLTLASVQPGVAGPPKSPRAFLACNPTCHIFETFGSFGIGAPALRYLDPVVETTSGRRMVIVPDGEADHGVKVEFAGDTSLCVAVAGNGVDIVQAHCVGDSGTVWFEQPGPHGVYFDNREFPNNYLSGPNDAGQFKLLVFHPGGGWEQQYRSVEP